ncbi:hypothetical protein EYF80_067416 [Liparis tanakae]|uniref:Laminin IV type B domain-containing protein n=1 Tax=Liparis tanakae TaxID=230148 RepID=A0A4Z2E1V8_9TELE|nr:hypothetical protein EYF80_067416 [Liparis tanakae]
MKAPQGRPLVLVLIPKYTELPGFLGGEPEAEQRREEMLRYMCLDSFMVTPTPALADMCSKLICSISSIIHDGALRESTRNHEEPRGTSRNHEEPTGVLHSDAMRRNASGSTRTFKPRVL